MIVGCIYCGLRRSEFSAAMVSVAEGFRCKSAVMCQRRLRTGTPRRRGNDPHKTPG
jgi:hypothetical protein